MVIILGPSVNLYSVPVTVEYVDVSVVTWHMYIPEILRFGFGDLAGGLQSII